MCIARPTCARPGSQHGDDIVGRASLNVVEEFNGVPGNPATFERLRALLEAQAFHRAY